MKKFLSALLCAATILLLCGCAAEPPAQIAATTLPVYEFTQILCQGTPLKVTRLVTEAVSCLHDYSLNVRQVKAAEAAEVIVISGAGLEDFLDGILDPGKLIDASHGIELIIPEEHSHEEEHAHSHDDGHNHNLDPHIWLDPGNAMIMARNICAELSGLYPEYKDTFEANLSQLLEQLEALQLYGEQSLSILSCREMITFHDGFSYLADAFDLHIVHAIEEESGREASAAELIHICNMVRKHQLTAVFTEKSGSATAANIISAETGVKLSSLDMAMSGDYFTAMYYNINTLKEALG